jgi:hypothetical protein
LFATPTPSAEDRNPKGSTDYRHDSSRHWHPTQEHRLGQQDCGNRLTDEEKPVFFELFHQDLLLLGIEMTP